MKSLTEAQVMAYRSAMVPPSPAPYHVDRKPTRQELNAARHSTDVRRAIEAYQEERAIRLAMEL
ncbi:hypothetical protein ACL00X_11210 [Aeromonas diversa]|uniref:hypothetical protein n=1 Tax=Aeromonas diversa TaxID=502790 RepID=UPI0039A02965